MAISLILRLPKNAFENFNLILDPHECISYVERKKKAPRISRGLAMRPCLRASQAYSRFQGLAAVPHTDRKLYECSSTRLFFARISAAAVSKLFLRPGVQRLRAARYRKSTRCRRRRRVQCSVYIMTILRSSNIYSPYAISIFSARRKKSYCVSRKQHRDRSAFQLR